MVGKWLVSPRTYPLWTNRFWSSRLYLRTLEWPVEVGIFIYYILLCLCLCPNAYGHQGVCCLKRFLMLLNSHRASPSSVSLVKAPFRVWLKVRCSQRPILRSALLWSPGIKISKVYTQPNPSLASVWKKKRGEKRNKSHCVYPDFRVYSTWRHPNPLFIG